MINNPHQHIKSSSLIKRIVKDYISSHTSTIVYALTMMIVSSAATGFHAWLVQPALDDVLINSNKNMLVLIPIIIIGSLISFLSCNLLISFT